MKTPRQIVKKGVSAMFWNNKGKILTLDMMANKFLKSKFWDSMTIRDYFAEGYGIKGTIVNSIHELRVDGRFIFSPDGVNGYVELDFNDDRSPEFWDKILDANERIREQIPISERKRIKLMLRKFVKRCEKKGIKEKCIAVAKKHKIKV